MKIIFTIAAIIIAATYSMGQETISLKSKPRTVAESFMYFDKLFDDTAKYTFKVLPEDLATGRLRNTMGRWVRENWGLHQYSELKLHLRDSGFSHPEDMSDVLLRSYHRHLNGRPLKIAEEAKIFRADVDYYRVQKELLQYFPVGDTIAVNVSATSGGNFGFFNSSVKGVAVVQEHRDERIIVKILQLEKKRGHRPESKVGRNYETTPYNCNILPPNGRGQSNKTGQ